MSSQLEDTEDLGNESIDTEDVNNELINELVNGLKEMREERDYFRRLFENEQQERRELQNILFEKLGVIAKEKEQEYDLEKLEPVRKFYSLSSLRKQAEAEARKNTGIVGKNEMTEAERLFQEQLDKANKSEKAS